MVTNSSSLLQQQRERREEKEEDTNYNYKLGFIDLYNVVQCLGESCPWTASVSPKSMLKALNSEICELYDEIDYQTQQKEKHQQGSLFFNNNSSSVNNGKFQLRHRKDELIDEIGDILFDALMIELVCRREYNIGPNAAWDAAITKIKRRTPYMKQWNNGLDITASTVEDCEAIWKDIKAKEPKKEKLVSTASYRRSDHNQPDSNNGDNISKTIIMAVVSSIIGFSVGVLVSRSSSVKPK